jgi:hypothetical protein
MSKPFVPDTPEEKITIEITVREAVLLTKLRKIPYGKILVHKAGGLIVKADPTGSVLIEPKKEDIDLT